ncbi:hypothetical protein BDN70DRAFT_939368 [Pholiota conissans]|uniref:Uncharacterized protein n=1 Tax=Pholiota conissans TaxID=109636 RepID=A0A9P6CSB1_9AGAR|nr:hypothetical protein BDN70DRAFT_939368 [Pholiota conissans]
MRLICPPKNDFIIPEFISCELANIHEQYLQVNDATKTLDPSNSFSASSRRYGFILNALDADPSSDTAEVLIIRACIQLLTAGSDIIQHSTSYFESAEEVTDKLRAQKIAGALKDAIALKLLDLTITQAKTGFKKANDIYNICGLLIPLS